MAKFPFPHRDPRQNGGRSPLIGGPAQASLPAVIRDRFGRTLRENDLVDLPGGKQQLLFRVTKIVPNLEPGAPPNAMRIQLLAQVDLIMPGGVPIGDFVRVLSVEEQGGVPQEAPAPPTPGETLTGDGPDAPHDPPAPDAPGDPSETQ